MTEEYKDLPTLVVSPNSKWIISFKSAFIFLCVCLFLSIHVFWMSFIIVNFYYVYPFIYIIQFFNHRVKYVCIPYCCISNFSS